MLPRNNQTRPYFLQTEFSSEFETTQDSIPIPFSVSNTVYNRENDHLQFSFISQYKNDDSYSLDYFSINSTHIRRTVVLEPGNYVLKLVVTDKYHLVTTDKNQKNPGYAFINMKVSKLKNLAVFKKNQCPLKLNLKEGDFRIDQQLVGEIGLDNGRMNKQHVTVRHMTPIVPRFYVKNFEIFVSGNIDRERTDFYSFTLELFDEDVLLDECAVEIKIDDINDTPPHFEKKIYVSVLKNSSELYVGKRLLGVRALDADMDSEIAYEIRAESSKYPIKLSADSGNVIIAGLTEKVYNIAPDEYKYTVFARDENTQVSKNGFGNATLLVKFLGRLEFNKNHPPSDVNLNDKLQRGSTIFTAKLEELDKNWKIRYSISPNTLFTIDPILGDVRLSIENAEMLSYIKSELSRENIVGNRDLNRDLTKIQNDAEKDYKTITIYAAKGKLRVSKSVKIHLRSVVDTPRDVSNKKSGWFGIDFKKLPLVPIISSTLLVICTVSVLLMINICRKKEVPLRATPKKQNTLDKRSSYDNDSIQNNTAQNYRTSTLKKVVTFDQTFDTPRMSMVDSMNPGALELASKRPSEAYEAVANSHQNNSLSFSTFSEPKKSDNSYSSNFQNSNFQSSNGQGSNYQGSNFQGSSQTSNKYQSSFSTPTNVNQNLSTQLSSFANSYAQMKTGTLPKQAYVNNAAQLSSVSSAHSFQNQNASSQNHSFQHQNQSKDQTSGSNIFFPPPAI